MLSAWMSANRARQRAVGTANPARAVREHPPNDRTTRAREETELFRIRRRLAPLMLTSLSLLYSCDKKDDLKEQGAVPPPIESSKPGACAQGGGDVKDKVTAKFFPRQAGSYCVDPNGETRSYGKDASGTLETVCTEQFDGECEVYKSYGLDRVVTLRYIDGKGSSGSVSVNLSRFESPEGAYGFFTKRVVADSDPLDNAPKPLNAGAAGALGTGVSYVWRGNYVAELSYVNELESPDQLAKSSAEILPPIARALGAALPGKEAMLPAVAALPSADQIDLGVSYEFGDVLHIAGTGPGAVGFYKSGPKRYRVFSLVRPDEAGAKDVVKTLRKVQGAKGIKNLGFDALTFEQRVGEDGPKVAWVVGRRENRVFGVGDEEFVATGGQDSKDKLLSATEKLERLKALIDSTGAGAEQR